MVWFVWNDQSFFVDLVLLLLPSNANYVAWYMPPILSEGTFFFFLLHLRPISCFPPPIDAFAMP